MKALRYAIICTSLFAASCGQTQETTDAEIVFLNVNVIPMDKEEILSDQHVVISKGKIVSVADASPAKYPEKAILIDGKGKYLIPGLAEMHAHVPPNDDSAAHHDVLKLFALHGITTIRGMLGHPSHLKLRDDINSGKIFGPKLYTSGPSFSGQSVKSETEAVEKVKEQKQSGYDFLKIHPGLTKQNFAAVARTAKQEGIPFAGHISFDVGVWNSIDADYQTIDHLDGFVEGLVPGIEKMTEQQTGFFGLHVAGRADTNKISELTAELKKHNVWVVPTQALAERWIAATRTATAFASDPEMKYMDPKTIDNWKQSKENLQKDTRYDSAKTAAYIDLRRKIILACQKADVGLLLGCDAPQVFNVPGIATHHELKYLVDAGLTPYEALQTGTVNVAAFYDRKGSAGIVRDGAASDLILLAANPLENITNTTKIEGVLINNKWLPKKEIDEMLTKLVK